MLVVLLHALPFDGWMWDGMLLRLPEAVAPTLYGRGDSIQDWAQSVLDEHPGDDMFLVGCSVGGSCALEMIALPRTNPRIGADRHEG